jgi:ABC-type multidrug transport system ATPase subunit
MAVEILLGQGLAKRYGKLAALSGVDVCLNAGEWLGLFGANGSGKSTLLSIVAGAARPDAGSLRFAEVDVLAYPQRVRGRIGYVPQEIALFYDLSVVENLLVWSTAPARQARDDAERVMAQLDLSELAGKRVQQLSGGTKRRVNLAVALLQNAELLVLDEPFAGVDDAHTDLMLGVLRELKTAGVAGIISDHVRSRLTPLIDRSLVLDSGSVA